MLLGANSLSTIQPQNDFSLAWSFRIVALVRVPSSRMASENSIATALLTVLDELELHRVRKQLESVLLVVECTLVHRLKPIVRREHVRKRGLADLGVHFLGVGDRILERTDSLAGLVAFFATFARERGLSIGQKHGAGCFHGLD